MDDIGANRFSYTEDHEGALPKGAEALRPEPREAPTAPGPGAKDAALLTLERRMDALCRRLAALEAALPRLPVGGGAPDTLAPLQALLGAFSAELDRLRHLMPAEGETPTADRPGTPIASSAPGPDVTPAVPPAAGPGPAPDAPPLPEFDPLPDVPPLPGVAGGRAADPAPAQRGTAGPEPATCDRAAEPAAPPADAPRAERRGSSRVVVAVATVAVLVAGGVAVDHLALRRPADRSAVAAAWQPAGSPHRAGTVSGLPGKAQTPQPTHSAVPAKMAATSPGPSPEPPATAKGVAGAAPTPHPTLGRAATGETGHVAPLSPPVAGQDAGHAPLAPVAERGAGTATLGGDSPATLGPAAPAAQAAATVAGPTSEAVPQSPAGLATGRTTPIGNETAPATSRSASPGNGAAPQPLPSSAIPASPTLPAPHATVAAATPASAPTSPAGPGPEAGDTPVTPAATKPAAAGPAAEAGPSAAPAVPAPAAAALPGPVASAANAKAAAARAAETGPIPAARSIDSSMLDRAAGMSLISRGAAPQPGVRDRSAEEAAGTKPAPPSTAARETAPAATAPVAVRAVADTWIQGFTPNGVAVFSRLLRAGETWTPPRPGLLLTTGNAGGTELVVNGVAGPPLGAPGAVLHMIPLDPARLKDGLPGPPAAAKRG